MRKRLRRRRNWLRFLDISLKRTKKDLRSGVSPGTLGAEIMTSSVIPARLEFQCGHAALVSLPRIKGESSAQRNERITREKAAAQGRSCDFCGPDVAIVVQASEPEPEAALEVI